MKLGTALSALALVSGLAGNSHAAQTLVSPGFPTNTNTSGACYLRNIGPRSVSVQVSALLNFSPGFITPDFENCNDAPLASGQTCVLLVNDLPDDVTFECSALVNGSAKNLRGNAELRAIIPAGGARVILADEMR